MSGERAQYEISRALFAIAKEVGRLATAQERIGTVLKKDQEAREREQGS